ncbi:hypothetical protein [Actinacidiphila acidipaludis]|uniref:Uncharacterized protein n=1 Tax=Actinacidiphila acidipaludis TaxID=2873382 RepID=A0ABS7QH79_9ACTN|nr:hypothetical protein [Streptomyces acidipaludis]MBY8882318.1 hypothetical protein [Streptomyces acidipaludis]
MDLIRLLVVLAVAAAACTGWRLFRYPGGWAYAFSRSHAADRADLDQARHRAGELDRASKKERKEARRQLERERQRHHQRLRAIEQRIDRLREPPRGTAVTSFGGLTLHAHSVTVDGREIPLAGLKFRVEHTKHHHALHVTQPGGRVRVQRYPRADHDEDAVRRFAVLLEDAAADENAFRLRCDAQLAEAAEELARAQGDTRAQDEARARITEIEQRQARDTRRHTAQKELDAARDRWHDLTGRRPR